MKICTTVDEFLDWRKGIEGTVGFVPTMGALHQGHISLIEESKKKCSNTVVSIFVNPTQFLEGEDLDAYPKRDAQDRTICERMRIDCLFMPTAKDMYFEDELTLGAPKVRGYTLEGAMRPGHFDGVLHIVLKLFHIVQPSQAYFGKKDAQQLSIITNMVKTLFMNVEIVAMNTVRESDGLALSSRNVYLSKEERVKALSLSKALREASSIVISKELNCEKIRLKMAQTLAIVDVEYIAFLDREFKSIESVEPGNTIIAVAAKVGTTRLIDNIWL